MMQPETGGPSQAFGWLAVGVELASLGCYYIGIWVSFSLPGFVAARRRGRLGFGPSTQRS